MKALRPDIAQRWWRTHRYWRRAYWWALLTLRPKAAQQAKTQASLYRSMAAQAERDGFVEART